jgi:hypothetical protein
MSIAVENLPLPRRCCAAAAMVFKKVFRTSLL